MGCHGGVLTVSTKITDNKNCQKRKQFAFKKHKEGIYGAEECMKERSTRAYTTRESCGVRKRSIPFYSALV